MLFAQMTKRLAAAAVLAGGTALTGWGMGVAHADTMEPHRWCPGDPKQMPYIVNQYIDWDWSVCHTWYPTNYGMGNVTSQGRPTSIWDGDNPPIEAITRRTCPPISFMCP
ncbi:hypothetical protein [Mycobacterium sp. E3339]|uniref:hypothetical protein n=1 Tax=Mycobacterium sp. E3339 TaxID=1834146 RepID=UPI0007FE51A9|nr:hypothetical protein [Mycobacterium sp. E3339]OBG63070.1 hypothetical protein A5702_23385 [Mycobacterium sp. E3339]